MHGRVVFDLPAVIVDVLAEVAFSVEKAHGGEWNAKVTGCFTVVSRENSETATINGEALSDTKFGGEVCDAVVRRHVLWLVGIPPGFGRKIGIKLCSSGIETLQESSIGCQFLPAGCRCGPEETDGVMTAILPCGVSTNTFPDGAYRRRP